MMNYETAIKLLYSLDNHVYSHFDKVYQERYEKAIEIAITALQKRDGSQQALDWFFIDKFLTLANDKPNKKKIRMQKKECTFKFNDEPFSVTFERGDKLNK